MGDPREALQRLVDAAWGHTVFKRRACFSIPVNEEQDADCILEAAITRLELSDKVVAAAFKWWDLMCSDAGSEEQRTNLDNEAYSVLSTALDECPALKPHS